MVSPEAVRIPVRMEDVVYTLNNIMDDIDRMYADTPNSSSMEGVSHPNQGLPTLLGSSANSATMPAPPAEDLGLDSDSSSLESYPTSPNPSQASSGFTSPSTSPTVSGFLAGGDGDMSPGQEDVGQQATRAMGGGDVQPHTSQLGPPEISLESVDCLSFSPPTTSLPSSPAASPELGPPSSSSQSSNFLPELLFDPLCVPSQENSDSNTTYEGPHFTNAQFINESESPQASSVKHMPDISPPHLTTAPPGLPPRPAPVHTSACDPLAHLPALRSPTLPSTPNLEQSQQWMNPQLGQAEGREASATYLLRQRQRARMMITRPASLPEPRNLPIYRPQAHHLYSYPPAGPPRSRAGAYNRRLNVAPRMLGKSWWEPWRKGGELDRAALAENRRRLRMLEDALREERVLEAADEAERQLIKGTKSGGGHVPNGQSEDEMYNTGVQEPENDKVPLASQETKVAEQGGSCTAQDQDETLLMATLVASFGPDSRPDPGSIDDASAHELCPDKSTGQSSDTMQVYVEDGVLVTPPGEQTTITSDTVSKDGTSPRFPAPTATARPDERLSKYAPRSKSPLCQSFAAPPSITRLRIPSVHEVEAEMLSAGSVWRKFTSMMF